MHEPPQGRPKKGLPKPPFHSSRPVRDTTPCVLENRRRRGSRRRVRLLPNTLAQSVAADDSLDVHLTRTPLIRCVQKEKVQQPVFLQNTKLHILDQKAKT